MKLSDSPSPAATLDVAARLAEVEGALAALAGELVPERVPGHRLERVMSLLGRIERRAGGARLVLAKAAADAGAWRASGARSAAEHLARQSGTSEGEARADLAASERLGRLPQARAAAVEGEMSKAKAHAVAEGAAADPLAESDLVDAARKDDLGTVRDKARKVRHRAEQAAGKAERRRYLRRGLRLWSAVDGEGRGAWNVPTQYQAAYAAALEPYRQEAFRHARDAGARPTPEALMADALQLLCLDALADHDLDPPEGFFDPACPDGPCAGAPPVPPDGHRGGPTGPAPSGSASDGVTPSAGPSSSGPDGALFPPDEPGDLPRAPSPHLAHSPPHAPRTSAGAGPRPSEGAVRSAERRFAERRRVGGNRRRPRQVVVRVDHSALVRGHVVGEETCEIPGIGPVPVSVVREWCQDAVLRVIVTKGVDVVAISTDTRYVAADVQRGLDARDPECVVPGCHAHHHLQNHHWRLDFAQGSPTDIDHLARICPAHHALVTHCGWTLTGGPGHWRFDPPSG